MDIRFATTGTSEPHARRRHALLARYPSIRSLYGFDRRTAWVTAAVVAAQVGVMIAICDWYTKTIGWFPMWIVPYRVPAPYPWLTERFRAAEQYVDFAIYGLPERRVHMHGGIKTLISENHYDEDSFWQVYDRDRYARTKRKMDPRGIFRDVFDKMVRARQARVVAPAVLGLLCLVSSVGCSAFEAECQSGERRCTSAGEIEECTPHPSGIDVSSDPVSVGHHDRSANTWELAASCGVGLCQTQPSTDSYGVPKQDAFCTLFAAPSPACATSTLACEGTTSVECRAGYPIAETLCASCEVGVDGCKGQLGATCAVTSDCASGLVCNPPQGCQMPCACAEGARCEACDVADRETVGPSRGTPFTFVCKSGWCARQYE